MKMLKEIVKRILLSIQEISWAFKDMAFALYCVAQWASLIWCNFKATNLLRHLWNFYVDIKVIQFIKKKDII